MKGTIKMTAVSWKSRMMAAMLQIFPINVEKSLKTYLRPMATCTGVSTMFLVVE